MTTNPPNVQIGPSQVPLRRRMGAFIECSYPWVLALVAGVAVWCWDPPAENTALAVERFVGGSIDSVAVLAGFQVTALSLLLSVADKPIVLRLKAAGVYNRLISFHAQAIAVLTVWLLASMLLLVVQRWEVGENGKILDLGRLTHCYAIGLVSLFVAALLTTIRVMILLVRLLRAN